MIHRYRLNGYNIVIDTCSGSVHAVDEAAYDIIALYGSDTKENIAARVFDKYKEKGVSLDDINECIDDIETLKNEGKLFAEDTFAPLADTFKQKSGNVVKALCLHVAHTCNLNCSYCFASQGKYHGDRALMSFEVGKRALDFLIENSGTRRNLEVDFFGGEPLMNWDVVKRLVEYARSVEQKHGKNFRFTLTTNGVLIDDDVIDFANREMSNVVLSLDGRKETNDRLRVTRNGQGSYDMIVPKFLKMAESRGQKDYYVRGTYTHYNTDFAADILHIADLGFKSLAMEPVVAPPEADYALKYEDLPVLFEQYDILAKEMLKREKEGRGFTFFHYMVDLEAGPCIYKRIAGCGVGTEYMAVTPTGELYPCHQFVGNEDFILGNVFDGIKNTELRDEFKLCNVYAREKCQDCFAKMYCSGGCTANAYHSTGSLTGTYDLGCELHKKRIECAIMMNVARQF